MTSHYLGAARQRRYLLIALAVMLTAMVALRAPRQQANPRNNDIVREKMFIMRQDSKGAHATLGVRQTRQGEHASLVISGADRNTTHLVLAGAGLELRALANSLSMVVVETRAMLDIRTDSGDLSLRASGASNGEILMRRNDSAIHFSVFEGQVTDVSANLTNSKWSSSLRFNGSAMVPEWQSPQPVP